MDSVEFKKEDIQRQYDKYKNEAEELLKNHDALQLKLKEAERKLSKIPLVGDDLQNFVIMLDMLRAYVKGEYKKIPTTTLISITIAVAYVASPIDLIPDWIPLAGFLDDAAVIKLAFSLGAEKDIRKYEEWRKSHES